MCVFRRACANFVVSMRHTFVVTLVVDSKLPGTNYFLLLQFGLTWVCYVTRQKPWRDAGAVL